MLVNENFKKVNLPLTLGASGVIGSAAATVDLYSSFDITANLAGVVLTLPIPTDPNFSDVVEVGGVGANTFSVYDKQIVPVNNEFAYFRWSGSTWQSLNVNKLSGNIIATALNVAPTFELSFSNFKVRMSANTSPQIATIVGTEACSILTEQEYPGGSFASAQPGSSVRTTLTTAYFTFDDGANVAGERFNMTLFKWSTNQMFRVHMWRMEGTALNWSGYIEQIGVTSSQIFNAGNAIAINNGTIHAITKSSAIFSRNATLATSTALDITWNDNIINGDISLVAGTQVVLTPSNGLTKTYSIRFNASVTFNPILNHICDFGFVSQGGQTINGVAVAANAQFGKGTTLFSTTNGSQEAGSGMMEWLITTSIPITFKVRVLGQTNTPTLGSTGSNRFPTLAVTEL